MTFRQTYAEKTMKQVIRYIESQRAELPKYGYWETEIHVSTRWHFTIQYVKNKNITQLAIIHQKRNRHRITMKNGVLVEANGIRRFDILFAALTEQLIPQLENGKRFKITQKKLNERYLVHSLFFWAKIEYYLAKKEDQLCLYEVLGDEKYKKNAERIEKGLRGYMEDKRNFIQTTKNMIRA